MKQDSAQKPVQSQQQTPKPAPQAAASTPASTSAPISTPVPPLLQGMNPPAPEPEDESMETNSDGSPKKRFWNRNKGRFPIISYFLFNLQVTLIYTILKKSTLVSL